MMRLPLRNALLGLGALALASGCGASNVDWPEEEAMRLPLDARQAVFDAENDLVIACNRQDEADTKKLAIERALHDLDQHWVRTQARLASIGASSRIPLARKVFDSNRVYLTAQLDLAKFATRTAHASTDVGRARLRLVRQRQLARIGRVPSESLKPLEVAVTQLERDMKSLLSEQTNLRTRVENQLDMWKNAEDEYMRASNDFDTGIWE